MDPSGPGRILEVEPLPVTATKKYSAHDFTTLLFPIKRKYITLSSLDDSCSPLPAPPFAVVAYSPIYKLSNPSAIIDCFTLRPTLGSSTTLCPGPHAGSTGTARTLPKPRARPSATLALRSTPGLPILASGGLGSSALHPRFAHSGLRRGSDLLASHRLHSDSVSPARPRQPGSGPGRLGPEPDRAG